MKILLTHYDSQVLRLILILYRFLLQLKGERINDPDRYAYLCPDGRKVPLDQPPCAWAARLWSGFLADSSLRWEYKNPISVPILEVYKFPGQAPTLLIIIFFTEMQLNFEMKFHGWINWVKPCLLIGLQWYCNLTTRQSLLTTPICCIHTNICLKVNRWSLP